MAFFLGGAYGWEFGKEYSGVILGAVLALTGAVVAPTLVAILSIFIGSLFGSKP